MTTPTATLNRPVPAFPVPADATTTLRLTQADVDLLRSALDSHLTRLIAAWERATDRGGRAEAEALNRRMHQLDALNRTLAAATYR
jgi:hypothetical protein